ncbi:hypothetical protein [uncultured Deinococcus sp.]|uniref:hypothetical protein n=1 Tax=uncultured Deinococcus sp. TaxID=158789 RepID=UPI002590ECB2|nr:hypothetical protein [uncultured Deinococcus sp.]
MTASGKSAVRQAFASASGNQWPTVRQEYVATRVEALYDPFSVDDLDAAAVALDLVRRAYLQGLKLSTKVDVHSRTDCAQREATYAMQLMEMFNSQTDAEWVNDKERACVESSIRQAFRAGYDEGRLPIGAVI